MPHYKKIIKELRLIVEGLKSIGADKLQQKTMSEAADIIEMLSWVSVDDRFPKCIGEHSKVVWCLDARGKTGFGIYQKELQHEGWFTGGGVGEGSIKITHWMPLPELPDILEGGG